MAQAALLNIRGAQVQAELLQNQAKLNVPHSTAYGGEGVGAADGFGGVQSNFVLSQNQNRHSHMPLHPLTISPAMPLTPLASTPGFGTTALPNPASFGGLQGHGFIQQNNFKTGDRYVEPFGSATNTQSQAQVQEYARLLESMSLSGMNTGGAGMDLSFDSNTTAVAAANMRNGRSLACRMHDLPPAAVGGQAASPILTAGMSPALMAQAQTLALLQQQREQELFRLQQHKQHRAFRNAGSAINVDLSANADSGMRSILDPANSAFDTARMLVQQQMKYQRQQQANFGVDFANSVASPMTDGNYASSPEFSDPRGHQQLYGASATFNNNQRHSAPSGFSSFLHQAAERHARNHSGSVEQQQQIHQQIQQQQQQRQGSGSEQGTPYVSPALTYASRTPSTLSPATPFFNAFNTPAIQQNQNQNQKAAINAGTNANNAGASGGVTVVVADGAAAMNRGLKNGFQHDRS